MIVKPPGRTLLDAAGNGTIGLECTNDGTDGCIIRRIQRIHNGLTQSIFLLQTIQQRCQALGIGLVVDAVKTGIRAQRPIKLLGIIPQTAKMELIDPIPLGIFLAGANQQRGMICQLLPMADDLTGLRPGEDIIQLVFGGLHTEAEIQAMVCHAAASLGKIFDPIRQCPAHIRHGFDGIAADCLQPGNISCKAGFICPHCLIRAESRQDDCRHRLIHSHGFVPMQIINRVIGGTKQLDIGLADNTTGGHIRPGKHSVAFFVDLHSILAIQRLLDVKITLQFQMGPMIQGITDEIGHRLRPLLKFLCISSISGDVMLRHTAGTHRPPLVVIATQPNLGNGIVTLVLINIPRVDMTMVIDNGHLLRIFVVKLLGRWCFQQKIPVHKGRHSGASFECINFVIL